MDPKSRRDVLPDVEHAGFFCMRTPLLAFDEWIRWSSSGDAGELRARLRAIVARPEIREAILIASPSLASEIDAWLAGAGDVDAKVERGLVRYLSRMCGRATPFGLFAGCSIGSIGGTIEATALRLADARGYRSHTRLDTAYLGALADELLRHPDVRDAVAFRPNSSLYRLADQFRYFEWKAGDHGHRTYGLVAVPATEYLELVLARSAAGARRADVILALASHDAELGRDEITAYVDELIASQVLVAEFPPFVTGPEALGELIERTSAIAALAPVTAILRETHAALAAIDAGELGHRAQPHTGIAARLRALPTPVDAAKLLQVDMIKPAEATLGPEVIAELRRAVELLHRLGPAVTDDPLHELAERFTKRYEQREVRLVEALDEEWGVAPQNADPSPWLEDLPFAARAGRGGEPLSDLHAFVLGEIQHAVRRGDGVLALEPAQLEPYFTPAPAPLPASFSVMATVAASTPEAVARGDFHVVVEGVKGPSGASLLGRFCHADPELHRRVEAYVRAEQAGSDAIYAEIVHLPQHRVGNIIARPVLRDHEIVYLGRSGAPIENQIPISDLLVKVVAGKFVLTSERLGREVIPRMTTAHALHGALAPYRFLGQLASAPALTFHLGPVEQLPFIPRIVVGRAVLHLATWRVGKRELAALGARTADERFAAVQALRAKLQLPRLVAVKDLDNELPIDLDNPLAVDSFVHLVKSRAVATLVEIYPGPGALLAAGPDGAFVHELVVPFYRKQPAAPRVHARPRLTVPARRQFAPGSDWLYVKLYTGLSGADRVLREVVQPVVERTNPARWFFLRYADPDVHVRVRFHGRPKQLREAVFPALHEACAPLLADGQLHRMQIDTYERELERYGGDDGIALAERVFHADSEAVLAIVGQLDRTTELDDRFRYALLGIDALLADLRLDLPARRAVIQAQRRGFGAELGVSTVFERGLGAKFRAQRARLDALFEPASEPAVRAALRRRSQRMRPIADKLHRLEPRLTVPVAELAKSFIHMHANRMLRGAARAHELVLYDFLDRCYASQLARAKQPRTLAAGGA